MNADQSNLRASLLGRSVRPISCWLPERGRRASIRYLRIHSRI